MECPVCSGQKKVLIAGGVPWPCGYCGGSGVLPDPAIAVGKQKPKHPYIRRSVCEVDP